MCVRRKGLGSRRAHSVRRGARSARDHRAVSPMEGTRGAAQSAGDRRPFHVSVGIVSVQGAELHAAGVLPKSRQLRRQPRQRVPLARPAGRRSRCGNLPGLRRRRSAVQRRRQRQGRRHRRHGHRQERRKTARYQPGMELHAKYTFFAEGCRGHLGKRLQQRFKLHDGARPADLRHRPQGTVGSQT